LKAVFGQLRQIASFVAKAPSADLIVPTARRWIEVYNAIGPSLGSRYTVAISELQAATTTATASPIAVLSQKRHLAWSYLASLRCSVSEPQIDEQRRKAPSELDDRD
jgi:hypothetical protein